MARLEPGNWSGPARWSTKPEVIYYPESPLQTNQGAHG
jgi:hypothetical protein